MYRIQVSIVAFLSLLPSVLSLFPQIPVALAAPSRYTPKECRCYPGDACWPTAQEWSEFNSTLGGKLVATVPLAAPCHSNDRWGAYNKAACSKLKDEWLAPEVHYESSSSIMAPYFANRSCDPFTSPSFECVVGTYIQYAVNVACKEDVAAAIKFASEKNLRLVVRNTGHDYNGKSTGAGALGIWMHHLKDMELTDWSSEHYTGKAIKMGAGIQAFEAYDLAEKHGLRVVGGECPTVGLSGGYTQGGGHSALMSKHGLAADQALEWEVVTGTGDYLVANRNRNTDLYWALSGGGGGTFGVVLSLTAKAHPDSPTSAMNLTFTSAGITQDTYYEAIEAFQSRLPPIVDSGAFANFYYTNQSFSISPMIAPDVALGDLKQYLAPVEAKLDELNIKFTKYYAEFPSYKKAYDNMFPVLGVGLFQFGGRLIPRDLVENDSKALADATRKINNLGAQFIGVAGNTSFAVAGDVYNSVNPAWRTNTIDAVIAMPWNFTAPWSDMREQQDWITEKLVPQLADITPEGAAYLNEGDFRQPN